jgi:Flp pilus assembly protein TadG
MTRIHRRFVREDCGQEIIEFAFASFIFFMTVFGTLEFGIAIWHYNMVANLAQEGARYASVRGSTSTLTGCDVNCFIQSRRVGITVTVTTPLGPPSGIDPGAPVSVRVATTFAPLTGLVPFATMTLESTAQMVVAR